MTTLQSQSYGLALIDKPAGKTSFFLVNYLRKLTRVKCIGHAGTLDPFATGLMVMLIGKPYTQKANTLIAFNKEYIAKLKLGISTDTFDLDGKIIFESKKIPLLNEIETVSKTFQGEIFQTPPMFSAKKVQGQKLYHLARQGISIFREPKKVYVELTILNFAYPYLDIHVKCSSGTYIRTIADDIGNALGTGAHLVELKRTKVGPFEIDECQKIDNLNENEPLRLKESW